jgi:hypothetical protein
MDGRGQANTVGMLFSISERTYLAETPPDQLSRACQNFIKHIAMLGEAHLSLRLGKIGPALKTFLKAGDLVDCLVAAPQDFLDDLAFHLTPDALLAHQKQLKLAPPSIEAVSPEEATRLLATILYFSIMDKSRNAECLAEALCRQVQGDKPLDWQEKLEDVSGLEFKTFLYHAHLAREKSLAHCLWREGVRPGPRTARCLYTLER